MDVRSRPIVAGFEARNAAERAADELLKWGLSDDDVVMAVRDHDYAASGGLMVRSEEEDAIAHLTHLIGLAGVPEDEARRLALRFDSSDAVVAVDAGERVDEARRVLRDHGGEFDGSEAFDRPDWEEARRILRGHWERRAGAKDPAWTEAEGGYHYVYEKASEPEFRGRTWTSAEPKLQSGFRRMDGRTRLSSPVEYLGMVEGDAARALDSRRPWCLAGRHHPPGAIAPLGAADANQPGCGRPQLNVATLTSRARFVTNRFATDEYFQAVMRKSSRSSRDREPCQLRSGADETGEKDLGASSRTSSSISTE